MSTHLNDANYELLYHKTTYTHPLTNLAQWRICLLMHVRPKNIRYTLSKSKLVMYILVHLALYICELVSQRNSTIVDHDENMKQYWMISNNVKRALLQAAANCACWAYNLSLVIIMPGNREGDDSQNSERTWRCDRVTPRRCEHPKSLSSIFTATSGA